MLGNAPYTGPKFSFFTCPAAYSKEVHHKNIPEKLYQIFDRFRQTVSCCRPGPSCSKYG